jgi:choline dehydrogenase
LDSSAATIPFSPPSSSASTFSSEVTEGYKTIYNLLVNQYYDEEAQVELLMSLTGQGTVSIQAAIQHPLSMGRVYVNSSDPFQMPLIDPQYYSHFAGTSLYSLEVFPLTHVIDFHLRPCIPRYNHATTRY